MPALAPRWAAGAIAAVAACGALATTSSSALAAPGWTPAAHMPSDAAPWSTAQILGDASGQLTAAHVDVVHANVPYALRARVETRSAGTAWTPQLSYDGDSSTLPDGTVLAERPDGAAGVCILGAHKANVANDPSGALTEFLATTRDAGSSSWGPVTALDTDAANSVYAPTCRVAVAADGTVAVLVQRTLAADGANVTPFSIEELFLHPPGGSWSAPIQVSTPDRAVSSGDLAFDDTGDLTIAWAERYAGGTTSSDSDDHYGMKVRVRTASNGVLGVRTDIGGEVWNQSAGSPVLGVNGSGRAVIAWQWGVPSGSSGDYQAWAVTRSAAGGAFSAPVQLVASATSASSGPRAAGVSPDGTAYVAYWRQGMSSADDLFGAERQPLGGSWTAEQGISPSNVDGFDVALAFLGSDALFVYKGTVDYGNPDAYDILQAVRWPAAASTPDAYRDLVSPGTISASDLALNADGSGGAILTWDDYVSGAQHAWAAAFDAAPPVLTSSGVPATATAGSAVTLTAAFADLWSPLSADTPTWDFGDGQTATGATVTHAWAAPGTFTVKVRGRDALGNELSKTYTVQVAAPTTPPGGGPPRDTTPPAVSLTKPRCAKRLSKAACRRHRAARSAWRTLRGTVTDAGGSGVESVEVGVARKQGSRYYVLRGKTFKKGSKAVFQRTFARAVVRGAAWSLRLPGLKPGTYVLRLRATDNAGNVSRVVTVPVRLR